MPVLDQLYLATTVVLVLCGLTMVWFAVRAYEQTSRRAMIHLSIGFTLIVAAATATTISAFLKGFYGPRSLLLVNNGMSATGFIFVVYSLITYE